MGDTAVLKRGSGCVAHSLLRTTALVVAIGATLVPQTAGAQLGPQRLPEPRALVLEPFAEQLGHGHEAGQQEANALASAGFAVDVLRDQSVTIRWLAQHLTAYAVIYINTHSGELPNGDIALATGEQSVQGYGNLLRENSVAQIRVTPYKGGPHLYYDSITGRFILRYLGQFSPHSIVIDDSCWGLDMPLFWQALKARGVGTLIGWHSAVGINAGGAAELFVLKDLARGRSVEEAILDAKQQGVGISRAGKHLSTLSYRGGGDDSFGQAWWYSFLTPRAPQPVQELP